MPTLTDIPASSDLDVAVVTGRLASGLADLALRIHRLSKPEYLICLNCLRVSPRAEWQTQGRCPGCSYAKGYEPMATQPHS